MMNPAETSGFVRHLHFFGKPGGNNFCEFLVQENIDHRPGCLRVDGLSHGHFLKDHHQVKCRRAVVQSQGIGKRIFDSPQYLNVGRPEVAHRLGNVSRPYPFDDQVGGKVTTHCDHGIHQFRHSPLCPQQGIKFLFTVAFRFQFIHRAVDYAPEFIFYKHGVGQ